jgi:hypothetical protein
MKNRIGCFIRLYYVKIARFCAARRFVNFFKQNGGGEGGKPSGFLYLFFSKHNERNASKEITFEQRQQSNKEFLEKRGLGHTFVRERDPFDESLTYKSFTDNALPLIEEFNKLLSYYNIPEPQKNIQSFMKDGKLELMFAYPIAEFFLNK